ncbi:MAG: ribosome rescue GTPase HflX [Oceanococcus sp.]
MFDRPEGGDRALLVALEMPRCGGEPAREEFRRLALSTGAEIVGNIAGSRRLPDPRFFVGGGKAEEIADQVAAFDADLVIFNHPLSPAQERNLEAVVKARVLDRAGLILDIFARRARTHEGKLQVELAQLNHLVSRLVRGWSHLERQKGGIGLRGPGESQLEMDRRMIHDRMNQVSRRIEQVRRSRALNRQRRSRQEVPLVSLVGYTNAGKSTLFEALTGNETYIADKLFATLDTTLRRMPLPPHDEVILADTVGFVRDLPHTLVTAFRATLEETASADLLMHVQDASDSERYMQCDAVERVLIEIEADEVPRLDVFNKVDCLEDTEPRIDRDEVGRPIRVWISAAKGLGLDLLRQAISERLYAQVLVWDLQLPAGQGKLRGELFRLGAVLQETCDEDGVSSLKVRMEESQLHRLIARFGLEQGVIAPTVDSDISLTE